MSTAAQAAGISPEFIEQIRVKLRQTTVGHFIDGEWTAGVRGRILQLCDILAGAVETDRIERGLGRQTLWGAPAPKSRFLEGSRAEAFAGSWVPLEQNCGVCRATWRSLAYRRK